MSTTVSNGMGSFTPLLTIAAEMGRQAGTSVVYGLDGTASYSLGNAQPRTGTFEFLFADYTTAASALSRLSQNRRCNIDDDVIGNFYFVPSGAIDIAIDEDTRSLWTVSCEFSEVP